MMTLNKYFKTHDWFYAGYYLSSQINGRLYVLSISLNHVARLVDVVYGDIFSVKEDVKNTDSLSEEEMKDLVTGLFKVPAYKKKDDIFNLWHKLSGQESIGRFAAQVLE
jgi:hypothetical protein